MQLLLISVPRVSDLLCAAQLVCLHILQLNLFCLVLCTLIPSLCYLGGGGKSICRLLIRRGKTLQPGTSKPLSGVCGGQRSLALLGDGSGTARAAPSSCHHGARAQLATELGRKSMFAAGFDWHLCTEVAENLLTRPVPPDPVCVL